MLFRFLRRKQKKLKSISEEDATGQKADNSKVSFHEGQAGTELHVSHFKQNVHNLEVQRYVRVNRVCKLSDISGFNSSNLALKEVAIYL